MRKPTRVAMLGMLTTVALTAAVGCSSGASDSAPAPAAEPAPAPAPGQEGQQAALAAVGLASDGLGLVSFTTDDPASAQAPVPVTGLEGDTRLVGIDFRVQDNLLYGVGEQGGLYTTSVENPVAEKVGQLSAPLEGTAFGVDFNPAANALRIVSDTGQNLRQPFAFREGGGANPETAVDTPLTKPQPAPSTDTEPALGVTAGAYTNNDTADTSGTTLFDISTETGQVFIQSPANAGSLAPTGGLGVEPEGAAGFDIYSAPGGAEKTQSNEAYAALTVGGTTGLYSVDLLTGTATQVGDFGTPLIALAIATSQP